MTTSPALSLDRKCPYAPAADHVQFQREEPVVRVSLPTGDEAWALTRLEDIRTVLADPRFSAERLHPDFPQITPGQAQALRGQGKQSMISLDPPDHTASRRRVLGEFTVRRIAELKPRIQEIVDQYVDAMLAGPRPVDLVKALSLPVPSMVICEMLGVPYEDHEFFQGKSSTLVRRTTPPEQRREAADAIRDYIRGLVDQKVKEPGDDLLSRQLAKDIDHDELVSLGFLLLIAGHETTANMISLGTMTLLDHPETLAAVKADPSLTPKAVEELLRYFTIAQFATTRLAKEDVEVGGVLIKAGEGVIGLGQTANRDPEAFADPDTFDIERGARHHIAFGFGIHQCLGQNLARMELQIVFDTLFRKIPALRLATPVDDLPFKVDGAIYGLYELPVTW